MTAPTRDHPLRVLFLCTGNSARSQMAEAVLNRKGAGRFEAHSAGSAPAARVHPLAIRALREGGLEWRGHPPRGVAGLEEHAWDFVITVCDKARESCPVFPGQPILAHWGMPDPAAVVGPRDRTAGGVCGGLRLISRRIDLMLALPIEKLERLALESRVRAIGNVETIPETCNAIAPASASGRSPNEVRPHLRHPRQSARTRGRAHRPSRPDRHRGHVPLGRSGGLCTLPDETVAQLERSGIPGVAGNYDSTVATDYKHCGCRYEDPVQGATLSPEL